MGFTDTHLFTTPSTRSMHKLTKNTFFTFWFIRISNKYVSDPFPKKNLLLSIYSLKKPSLKLSYNVFSCNFYLTFTIDQCSNNNFRLFYLFFSNQTIFTNFRTFKIFHQNQTTMHSPYNWS